MDHSNTKLVLYSSPHCMPKRKFFSPLFEYFCKLLDQHAPLWIICQDIPNLVCQGLDVTSVNETNLETSVVILVHTEALVQFA